MMPLRLGTNWIWPIGLFKTYLWKDSVKCSQLSLGSPVGNTLFLRSRILTICSFRALWPPFKSLKHPTFLQVLSHVLKWRSAANKNRNEKQDGEKWNWETITTTFTLGFCCVLRHGMAQRDQEWQRRQTRWTRKNQSKSVICPIDGRDFNNGGAYILRGLITGI